MSDDNQPNETTTNTGNVNELPEWGRKAISEANAEAARYRLQAKTAADDAAAKVKAEYEGQLKVVTDEKSAITGERDKAVTEVTKLKVALTAGIPGETAVDFAGLLQGSTEAELAEHATKLKSMLGGGVKVKAVDPSHGFGGKATTANSPESLFANMISDRLNKQR